MKQRLIKGWERPSCRVVSLSLSLSLSVCLGVVSPLPVSDSLSLSPCPAGRGFVSPVVPPNPLGLPLSPSFSRPWPLLLLRASLCRVLCHSLCLRSPHACRSHSPGCAVMQARAMRDRPAPQPSTVGPPMPWRSPLCSCLQWAWRQALATNCPRAPPLDSCVIEAHTSWRRLTSLLRPAAHAMHETHREQAEGQCGALRGKGEAEGDSGSGRGGL
jgi:hypothetical protein